MYRCSVCDLLVGAEDETYCNEPSRLCPSCAIAVSHRYDDFDADELGLDPEEEFDA